MDLTARPTDWRQPVEYWPRIDRATRQLPAPVAILDEAALAWNAGEMVRRAAGIPIRIATKSIRVREVIRAVHRLDGFRGLLAFSLAEALWLADEFDDIVVGYPSVDRASLAALAANPAAAERITLMVDDLAQLEAIDAAAPPSSRLPVRVAIDFDASWDGPLGYIGARRSPIRTPEQLVEFARLIQRRPGITLVGVMSYEGQIAGVPDAPNRAAAWAAADVRGGAMRWVQRQSMDELRERRGAAIGALRDIASLEFVNGGGTGSLEATAADPAVTEIAAGSGLFGPALFDGYSHFTPAPAAAFALDVVRRPSRKHATLLGGGWIASGPAGATRVPTPVWPPGLSLTPREGAGEVQSPLVGRGVGRLKVGDRVWLRHAKAGELSEHVAAFAVVDGDQVREHVPTYRGEGQVFL